MTAVDVLPEVLAINAARVDSDRVHYVREDLFEWNPRERFDFVFFGFWLSLVPLEQFEAFWAKVEGSLKPDGRPFRIVKIFYDSRELQQRLEKLGWVGYVRTTGAYFIYGCVQRR